MHYSDLITLYFERSNALQNYWTLYVAVIGGLLAVSALRREPDAAAGLLVTALFCGFAYKNLDAIHDVTLQRFATLRAIEDYDTFIAGSKRVDDILPPLIQPTLNPPTFASVRNFHVACDIGTVITIWCMQWRRSRNYRQIKSL